MKIKEILNNEKNKYRIFIFLLFGLTTFMICCFMPINEIITGHDSIFHYRRLNALKDGSFPIYMDYVTFDNYGYGTRWFYPDLVLIPFAYLANLTGMVFAYKFMWFVMTILCGLFTYKMANRILRNSTAAIFGALLYTFSSYRLLDIFDRGALGEALSFTYIPIVFWGLYEIIKGDYRKWYIVVIGYALFINTHILSSVLIFITSLIFIVLYYKAFIKEPKRFYFLLLSAFVTIVLCSYFILPFIEQMLSQNFHINNMKNDNIHGLTFKQTLISILYPNIGFIKAGFQPYISLIVIFCIVLRLFVKDRSRTTRFMDSCTLIGIVYFLLTIDFFPWDRYPLKLLSFIQFPWRLYEYVTFFLSIALGYYFSKILRKNKKSIVLSSLLILTIIGFMITQSVKYKSLPTMTEDSIMKMEQGKFFFETVEYFPENLTIDYILKKEKNIDSKNHTTIISNVKQKNGFISCDIKTNSDDIIEFPLTYYLGYSAKINNKEVQVEESENGLVTVPINNSGKLVVEFTGTPIQRYSIYITLITLILLIIYIIKNREKNNGYQ